MELMHYLFHFMYYTSISHNPSCILNSIVNTPQHSMAVCGMGEDSLKIQTCTTKSGMTWRVFV